MRRKIFISVIILISCLFLTALFANNVEASTNFTYEENDDGTLSVSAVSTSISGSITIPSTIDGETVTEIAKSGFYNCSEITSVTIPNTVTTIGNMAFEKCTSLTSVTIPNTVTTIGSYAFEKCTSIKSITIPEGVENLGTYAFANCTSLTSITLPGTLTGTFGYCTFAYCTSLVSATFSSGMTTTGDSQTFKDCTSLKEVNLADTITEISGYTFSGCTSLTSITFPSNLKKIGIYAFSGSGLNGTVIIPETVESIGYNAFYEEDNPNEIEKLSLRKSNTVINLLYNKKTIEVGETYKPIEGVDFASVTTEDSSIATVSENGRITGVGEGTTTISYLNKLGSLLVKTEITVTKSTTVSISYSDVKSNDWYYDSVKYMYKYQIMTGVGDGTKFSPNSTLTRGMLVTILYRMEGEPSVTSSSKFSDVTDTEKWYYDAVVWASSKGVVNGYGSTGLFKPNQNITRQELSQMLYNYAYYKGVDDSSEYSLSSFADNSKVSSWAATSVKWAVGHEIITGVTSGSTTNIKPQGNATRAQAATMIYRYIKNVK